MSEPPKRTGINLRRKLELAHFVLDYLIQEACAHNSWLPSAIAAIANDQNAPFDEVWKAARAMMNVRSPWEPTAEFLVAQNELLAALIEDKGICTIADSRPSADDARMRLWRGDIVQLAVDAIVNAANAGMTGCWQPLHYCIDNAIHTFAGVQLRAKMTALMEEQGHEEPTAHARITSAYNLPAKHIIHTVGPIANGNPTQEHRRQLTQCYEACLDVAEAHDCLSIAFCCISTGVFGFPQREAAAIAVDTVRTWLAKRPNSAMIVVFDVFDANDEAIYRKLLKLTQE